MKKIIFVISILLNVLFIGLILLGMFKFNVLQDDVYIDGQSNEVSENVIYGNPVDFPVVDPNESTDGISDPDAEAIAGAESEDSQEFIDDEPAPVVDEEVLPAIPATTTSASSIIEPDNSPVEVSTTTEEIVGEEI